MLGKSSVLMMLLVGTGSLVAISSIYTPANVETQPQPQPQKPQTTIPGLKTPQSKLEIGQSVADQRALRAMEDKQLLDRLMPEIIKRINVNVISEQRMGQRAEVDVTGSGIDSKTATVRAFCAPGERMIGGAMMSNNMEYLNYFAKNPQPPRESWAIIGNFDSDGSVSAVAQCLKVELSLKSPQQPQAQQPSPPPGGPPLQPPPEFGK